MSGLIWFPVALVVLAVWRRPRWEVWESQPWFTAWDGDPVAPELHLHSRHITRRGARNDARLCNRRCPAGSKVEFFVQRGQR